MKKYFIFAINREYYGLYKKNIYTLYRTLKNLYEIDLNSLNYGISIYNQLCVPINKEILEKYYQDYKSVDNHFMIDNAVIEINNSCIIVLAKSLSINSLRHLHYYSYPLFACNFKDNEFFFLSYEYFKSPTNIIK